LKIWDTAGQETYRSINKIFYKEAKIVIFVYDITNIKSFKEIGSYWLHEVKNTVDEDTGK
jgi:small GTP-binding protein